MAAPIGHNSATRKYTSAEVESAIRISLRGEHIREDRSFMHRVRWELWLSKLSMRSKIVGLAILEHADKDGSNAFPSMDRLRVMVGGSKRDIKDAVDEFIKWEFVTFKEGRGRRSNEYRFHLSLSDLADYVDGSNVVPLRPSDGTTKSRCGTTVVPQDDNHSGTTVVPQDTVADEFVVPFPPVVVPSVHGCGTISPSAILRTRADLLTDLQDLHQCSGGKEPDGLRNMMAAATVAMMATITPMAAAASETQNDVHTTTATTEAQQFDDLSNRLTTAAGAALANPATCPGLLILAEPRRWIANGCTMQEIVEAVSAVATRARPGSIRSWSYFTQAVADAKATRLAALPDGVPSTKSHSSAPIKSWEDRIADTQKSSLDREIERMMQRGPARPREE